MKKEFQDKELKALLMNNYQDIMQQLLQSEVLAELKTVTMQKSTLELFMPFSRKYRFSTISSSHCRQHSCMLAVSGAKRAEINKVQQTGRSKPELQHEEPP